MIIAMVSKKGGVGKTTTSVNLAASLAGRGLKTLIVDLDSQGSTSLSLGLRREQFHPSVADSLLGNASLASAVRHTSVPNLDLVTSSAELARADQSLATLSGRDRILKGKLQAVQDQYDYVLLDCPPGLSLLPVTALVASDAFVVPVTPHFLALEGLENLIAAADRICHNNGTRTRLLGVLLTLVDYRTKLTRENVADIRERFGRNVFAIEIRINVRLAEAPSFGQTIHQYDPDCPGAQAYRLMAEELLLRIDGEHTPHHRPSTTAATTWQEPRLRVSASSAE